MIEEGSRVRLRPESPLIQRHPEMAQAIGIVGSIVRGRSWDRLDVSVAVRVRDVSAHVRFRSLNVVALNVPAIDLEAVDHINPDPPRF